MMQEIISRLDKIEDGLHKKHFTLSTGASTTANEEPRDSNPEPPMAEPND